MKIRFDFSEIFSSWNCCFMLFHENMVQSYSFLFIATCEIIWPACMIHCLIVVILIIQAIILILIKVAVIPMCRGMAKKVTISTLSPRSTYRFRYAFEQKGKFTEWSPEVTVTTTSKCTVLPTPHPPPHPPYSMHGCTLCFRFCIGKIKILETV